MFQRTCLTLMGGRPGNYRLSLFLMECDGKTVLVKFVLREVRRSCSQDTCRYAALLLNDRWRGFHGGD